MSVQILYEVSIRLFVVKMWLYIYVFFSLNIGRFTVESGHLANDLERIVQFGQLVKGDCLLAH
jgi:hypothetical protein